MSVLLKKIARLTLILCLAISAVMLHACSGSAPGAYIALGDSVAAGFGVAEEENYASVFYEMLKEGNYAGSHENMAVNGYTAATLLEFLNNIPEEELELFLSAGVVTLNIGGNNILGPFLKYLPSMDEFTVGIAEFMDFISDSEEKIAEMLEFAEETQEFFDNFSIADVFRLIEFRKNAAKAMGNVNDVFDKFAELRIYKMVSFLSGVFPDELEEELQQGVAAFSDDFGKIITWLEENAPEAVVIVNTLYNPFPQEILGLSLKIAEKADMFTRAINDIILKEQENRRYLIADIYAGFANEPNNMTNLFLDMESMSLSFDLIHPSAAGHQFIAELNHGVFEAYMGVAADTADTDTDGNLDADAQESGDNQESEDDSQESQDIEE